MYYFYDFFALFWPSYVTYKLDFCFKNFSKGLSKAGIVNGELRHVAREKEYCVPWL